MKTMIHAALAAAACLCASMPVAAQERIATTVRVPVSGLDLNSAAGRAILDTRLRGAIRNACAPTGASLAEAADSQRCRREMTADAAVRIAALRRGVQVAAR